MNGILKKIGILKNLKKNWNLKNLKKIGILKNLKKNWNLRPDERGNGRKIEIELDVKLRSNWT